MKDGLNWSEIQFELDTNDESIESDNKARTEWNECDFHHIKHHNVPGGCPLCLLRVFFEEKQRIAEEG